MVYLNEMISYKRLIKNLIISVLIGIVFPLILFFYIDPSEIIFNRTIILFNGVLYVISYSCFGLFKKNTFVRLTIGIAYLLIQLYFYSIGSNVFTLFLPHCNFGTICIDGEIMEAHLSLSFNYIFFIICILAIKGLNLIRNYYKVPKEEDEFTTVELKKLKQSNKKNSVIVIGK